jgi:3-dehydroquinate synthase
MKFKKTVTVGLGDRSYPIFIQPGCLHAIGLDLHKKNIGKRFGVISDDHVADLYGDVLLKSLTDAGIESELLIFPHGESSKNLQTIATLASELSQRGFDRGDALLALGGGVTGDMTGFLAAIYMRGIPFVQVPTTLLAQVDSSVGGKTGVDIPEGKNLVGCFYQPKAVYIDPAVLNTLPKQELLGGLAEVIKYGVIQDHEFFDYLDNRREDILALKEDAVIPLIARCCEIKAQVVEQDEREGGLRRILNFGHTIGHAVEAASEFTLIHGLAVSIGMKTVADLAVLGGHLSQKDADRLCQLLEDYEMPVSIPSDLDRNAIKQYLQTDKKTVGGRVFFVLPEAIGQVIITDQVNEAHLDEILSRV